MLPLNHSSPDLLETAQALSRSIIRGDSGIEAVLPADEEFSREHILHEVAAFERILSQMTADERAFRQPMTDERLQEISRTLDVSDEQVQVTAKLIRNTAAAMTAIRDQSEPDAR